MNYYPHHIGDYLTATAHLTMLEDGAYRRLLDLYYSREEPILADVGRVCRLVRATSEDDRQAVATVLDEFFTLTDAGWTHKRCEEEITRATEAAERSRKNGLKGGRPKDKEAPKNPEKTQQVNSGIPADNPDETQEEPDPKAPNPNTKTNTNPKTKARAEGQNTCAPRSEKPDKPDPNPKKPPKAELDFSVFPDDLSPQVLDDWLTMRKGIKAPANTQTVLNAIAAAIEECRSLGVTPDEVLTMAQLKAWRGLRKDWVANELAKRGPLPGAVSGNVSQLSPVGERTKRNMEAWLAHG